MTSNVIGCSNSSARAQWCHRVCLCSLQICAVASAHSSPTPRCAPGLSQWQWSFIFNQDDFLSTSYTAQLFFMSCRLIQVSVEGIRSPDLEATITSFPCHGSTVMRCNKATETSRSIAAVVICHFHCRSYEVISDLTGIAVSCGQILRSRHEQDDNEARSAVSIKQRANVDVMSRCNTVK